MMLSCRASLACMRAWVWSPALHTTRCVVKPVVPLFRRQRQEDRPQSTFETVLGHTEMATAKKSLLAMFWESNPAPLRMGRP